MTTCTPDYLSEDLIDCERRPDRFGGYPCRYPTGDALEDAAHGACGHIYRLPMLYDEVRRTKYGATPAPHPADFPRCKLRPMITHKMGMMQWYATEGGRKCPMCGRYAKAEDLGNLSRWIGNARISAYGHIEGRGCNKPAPGTRP